MENNSSTNSENIDLILKQLLTTVFGWMGIGLAITAFVSYQVSSTPTLLSLLIEQDQITLFGYFILFSPLLFVLLLSLGFNRLSYYSLTFLFIMYSILMGASLSFVFLIYTNESIYSTFLVATAMFGTMAIIGYFTKSDLSNLGNILLMALVGIIISSLINVFLRSDSFSYLISFAGVIVFSGLTAWDTQKLKNIALESINDQETISKFGIMGALTLYLDFINLFLSLLRLFSNRKRD